MRKYIGKQRAGRIMTFGINVYVYVYSTYCVCEGWDRNGSEKPLKIQKYCILR